MQADQPVGEAKPTTVRGGQVAPGGQVATGGQVAPGGQVATGGQVAPGGQVATGKQVATPGKAIEESKPVVGPHAAAVVKITGDHKYELDAAELDKVLMRDDIQDLPVVVVSVAGVYRAGKSFLLNFFLRYLKSPESEKVDGSWLSVGSKPLEGFSWRGGGERNTTGILLWSEPVVTVLPSGQKVAILLMDTQGTFDSSSTFRDCSTVFALSILLSSVQIYNLFYNINENDLQHLQFFTDYGRAVNEQSGKPFQTLEFLVRDWQYPYEHKYGEDGGKELLNSRLQIKQDQVKELREVREHIHSLFEKVSCFLMPHPGFAVTEPDFKGAIIDLNPKFVTHLKTLVTSLFSPDKLLLKKINGEVVNAREYATYFKAYMKIFNSDTVPPAGSILQVTTEAGLLSASNEARRVYENGMEKDCGVSKPSVPLPHLKTLHAKYIADARTSFTSKKKMGSKEDADRYLQKLMTDLEARLAHYQAINLSKIQKAVNDAKTAYENSIEQVHGSKMLCVHAVDLERVHNDAVNAAIKIFDAARPRIAGAKDDERNAFIKSFDDRYTRLQIQNKQNNEYAVMKVRSTYSDFMQKQSLVEPPLSGPEFQQKHNTALQQALDDFKKERNLSDSYTEDVYKSNLVTVITNSFVELQKLNKSKNKIQINKAIDVYNDYMHLTWHFGQCLHPQDLINEHKIAKCRALVAYKPDKFCADGYDFNDEDQVLLSQMLESRYEELRGINDTTNQGAVQEAFEAFKRLLQDRLKFSWWWLLVIPLIQTAASIPKYVQEAKDAAYNVFRSRRRPGAYYPSDPYIDQLNEMMDSAMNRK